MPSILASLLAPCALALGALAFCAADAVAGPPPLSAGQIKVMSGGKAIVKTLKPTDDSGVAARAMAIIDGATTTAATGQPKYPARTHSPRLSDNGRGWETTGAPILAVNSRS